jgi:PAS domain S-box-containing protein
MASPAPADAEMGMSERIAALDWASVSGGEADTQAAFRIALEMVTRSEAPLALYWGPDLLLFYNDSWAPFLGQRHPWALGKPAREVWPEIWEIVGPQFDQVIATGRGHYVARQMLPMARNGVEEETYWNYSFTPVIGPNGGTEGILNHAQEITAGVQAERRLSLQISLADRLRSLTGAEELKAAAASMLGEYLGAARVGFADVSEEADSFNIDRDWRRDESVPSLEGRRGRLSQLPEAALAHLRTGDVLGINDVSDFSGVASDADAALGELLGVKALLTVPLVREGKLRAMLYVHEPEPRGWKRSEMAMARDVAERSWAAVERAESEQRLRESEDHYRHAVELNPQVSWTALPDGQLNRVSKRWFEWTGTPGTGESWADGLHPNDVERTFAVWGRAVATGEPYDIEHRVKHRDGSYRWARSRAFPRHAPGGDICLWYGTTEDIDERKLAEDRQRLLINELNHRVKNTLATVQAIAFQTLKGDIPVAEARSRFETRLQALSRAHNLLTDENWEGASLHRVVADATAYLADEQERFQVEGEEIWLAPRSALALSLALHELSTNAAKYGALSREGGRVRIGWSVENGLLNLVWKEQGGPEVTPPAGRGFGSRLIERGLGTDLGGTARLAFEPDGLRCTVKASLDAIQAGGSRG